MMDTISLPGPDDVLAAAARIAGHAHLTPVLRARTLDDAAGCSLHFKAEHLQRAGAFKVRGAFHAVKRLIERTEGGVEEVRRKGVVTHSSGESMLR